MTRSVILCQCLFFIVSCTYSQDLITVNGKKYLSDDRYYQSKYAGNYLFLDPSGNRVSFEKFKGKFIYLSLYFIGCGNCDIQFPYAHKLSERFARYDTSIVFVNLCIVPPRKKEDWQQFIVKYKLDGYNLAVPGALFKKLGRQKIYRDLKADGVPTYIILDWDGRILGHDVPEPGSGVIIAYMLGHLSSGTRPTMLVPQYYGFTNCLMEMVLSTLISAIYSPLARPASETSIMPEAGCCKVFTICPRLSRIRTVALPVMAVPVICSIPVAGLG